MRSSDLFYGLFATMAGFFVVVALAAGIGGSVIVILILAAALSLHLMFSRASQAPQVSDVWTSGFENSRFSR